MPNSPRRDPGDPVACINIVVRGGGQKAWPADREWLVQESSHVVKLSGGDCVDEEYGRGVPDAGMHDVDVLPHLHDQDQIDELFPRAVAEASGDDDYPDYQPSNSELVYGPIELPLCPPLHSKV